VEHAEKLKQIRGIGAGLGIAVVVGVAIWGIGKLLSKKDDGESDDIKDRRHARQWSTAEEEDDDDNDEDQEVYARF
jgi:hypothetical protein